MLFRTTFLILLPAARRVFPSAAHGALALLFALALVSPRVGHAQSSVSAGVTAAVARARTLANDGEDAKSRALLDSVVNGVSRDSFDAAEALYWRALLAEGSATAELDWKRIVVDVPFSPRASEALFKLSELDLQRANRTLARQHVQQLLNDYPTAPERPRAMLVLARSYFDERDAPRGCGVLTAVRKEAPLSAVEVRLQADELQQQCRNVRELALGAAPDPTVVTTPAAVPPLATQTAALPPVAPPTTAARPTRGTTVNADSVRRDSTARAAETRNATRAIADSIRRDSVARFAVSRTAAKQAADSIRRDSVARVTASRTAARQAADSIRRDSIVRAIAQRVVDSTRRDSVAKAGLLRAAAQRIADNARRDSLTRETLRRDSIALDKIRPSGTGSTTGRGQGRPRQREPHQTHRVKYWFSFPTVRAPTVCRVKPRRWSCASAVRWPRAIPRNAIRWPVWRRNARPMRAPESGPSRLRRIRPGLMPMLW